MDYNYQRIDQQPIQNGGDIFVPQQQMWDKPYQQQQPFAPHQQLVAPPPGYIAPHEAPVRVGDFPKTSNLTLFAVLACLFCCFPIGLFAIVTARRAEEAVYHGDSYEAWRKAKLTKRLIVMSIVFGILLWVCGVVLVILRAVALSHLEPSY
ncbi:hypothetical protein QOT17_005287 [Balamuthia mandrillaris]